MIRPHEDTSIVQGNLVTRMKRRQLFRIGFLTATLLATGELLGATTVFASPQLRLPGARSMVIRSILFTAGYFERMVSTTAANFCSHLARVV